MLKKIFSIIFLTCSIVACVQETKKAKKEFELDLYLPAPIRAHILTYCDAKTAHFLAYQRDSNKKALFQLTAKSVKKILMSVEKSIIDSIRIYSITYEAFLRDWHAYAQAHDFNQDFREFCYSVGWFLDCLLSFFTNMPEENQQAIKNEYDHAILDIKSSYGGFHQSRVQIFLEKPLSCGQLLVLKLCELNKKLSYEEKERRNSSINSDYFELISWNNYREFFADHFIIKPSNIHIY